MKDLISAVLPPRRPTNLAPVPYTGRGRHGLAAVLSGRGGPMDRERQAGAMESSGALFTIVGGIAQDVAAVEWHLHRLVPGSNEECPLPNCDEIGVELVEQHAALDVWNNPNDFMARQELVETVQQHLDLTGEGWTLFSIARMVGWPVELWPVYPHRMSPVPDRKKFIAGYVYCSPDGEEVPLKLPEVGLMRQPHPLDVMRGLSAVGALSVDLDTANAARVWNRNFFLNSAEPGGIIEVPRRLTDDEWDEMRSRWEEQHRGVSAAHRVAIIEGENTRWVDRKYTMQDMQFAELLGMSDAAIRKAYRYPVSMMGESGDVNRATAEAHRAQYATNLLVPRLNRWKGMLNRKLLPPFGPTARDLRFAYSSPVPADKTAANEERVATATAAEKLVRVGYTGDSVKVAYGLPDALVWEKPTPPPAPGDDEDRDGEDDGRGGQLDGQRDDFARAAARLLGAGGRPRNGAEERGEVDHEAIQRDWQNVLDELLDDWRPVLDAQLDHLDRQIRDAVTARDMGAAGRLQASTGGADVLASAMDRLARKAEARAVAEAKAQGVEIGARWRNDVSAWTAAAVAVDGLLSAGLLVAAGRELLRWLGYGKTAEDTAEAVVGHVRDGSASVLRGRLGGVLTWAQNRTRIVTFARASKEPTWYASEVNDGSTCKPCSKIDGRELPTVDAVNLAYGGGGYLYCLGLDRCRGMPVAVWE